MAVPDDSLQPAPATGAPSAATPGTAATASREPWTRSSDRDPHAVEASQLAVLPLALAWVAVVVAAVLIGWLTKWEWAGALRLGHVLVMAAIAPITGTAWWLMDRRRPEPDMASIIANGFWNCLALGSVLAGMWWMALQTAS